jgi:hypothetical protein
MDELPQVAPEATPQDKEHLAAHGGEVLKFNFANDIEEVKIPDQAPGPRFSPEEHRAKATKLLALLLFAALIATFVAHIASVLWLAHDKPNSVEEVGRVFNTWIPVFSGLFGSAATFYFTQGRK